MGRARGTRPSGDPLVDPATAVARTTSHRELLPAMRGLLLAFSVLTALAVLALFLLPARTAEVFAWTIEPPLSAAFLGAGYAAGCTLVLLSLRDPVWADSRVPVLTILVFALLTLAATLLHLDRFHFQPEFAGAPLLARASAWIWTAVYVAVPVAMVVLLARQERGPGTDPPPRWPVPLLLRAALAVESAVLLVTGIALYAVPSSARVLWPWELPPLTARVVAAWLVAFGLATALATVAGDLQRLRTAAVAYAVFGLLVVVSLARYADAVTWGSPVAWVFLLLTLAITATGVAGWRSAPVPVRDAS